MLQKQSNLVCASGKPESDSTDSSLIASIKNQDIPATAPRFNSHMQETPLLVIFILLQKKKKKKTVFESTVCFLCTIKNIKLNFKSSYQKDEKGQSRSGGWGGRGGRTTSTTVGGGRGGKEGRKDGAGRRVQKQGSSKEVRGGRDGERLGSPPPPLPAVLCNTVHFGFQILLLFYSKKTKKQQNPKNTKRSPKPPPPPKTPAHLIVSHPRPCTFKTLQAHRLANPAPQKPPPPPPPPPSPPL